MKNLKAERVLTFSTANTSQQKEIRGKKQNKTKRRNCQLQKQSQNLQGWEFMTV